jgi:hypothetical protein
METIVQFLQRGHAFMARGQRHIVKHPIRKGVEEGVLVIGAREDGQYFEAEFAWGDTVDVLSDTL